MTSLSGLFFCRAIGQALVRIGWGGFLPPLEEWESGILPHPLLVLAQIAILAVMTAINWQAIRGYGFLVTPRLRVGMLLRFASVLYFGGMIARYVISMLVHPERQWFGDTIPIVFHCVLATYLFLYSWVFTAHQREHRDVLAVGRSGDGGFVEHRASR